MATTDDMNKHNGSIGIVKTRRCFESIPSQLGDTNEKSTFPRISDMTGERPGLSTKQKHYDNTEWLGAAGYGMLRHLLKQPAIPLKANEIADQCRMHLFVTGMLVHAFGPAARIAVFDEDYRYNQGAVAENVVRNV